MLRSGQGPASMGLQGHLQRIGGLISRIWEGTKGCLRKGCNSHVLKAHFVCHVDKGLESVLKSDTETINRRWSHCAGHRNGTELHDTLSLSLRHSQSSKGSGHTNTGLLTGHVLCHRN